MVIIIMMLDDHGISVWFLMIMDDYGGSNRPTFHWIISGFLSMVAPKSPKCWQNRRTDGALPPPEYPLMACTWDCFQQIVWL